MDPNQAQPNLQEPPTPQFNTPDSLHWLKILSISLLAILVLSIVGIGAYFLGKGSAKPQQISTIAIPTPDLNREPTGSAATANWKTYASDIYGYSMKYPDTIIQLPYEKKNNNPDIVLIDKNHPQGTDSFTEGLYILINGNNSTLSLNEYVDQERTRDFLSDAWHPCIKNSKAFGAWRAITLNKCTTGLSERIYIKNKNTVLSIYYSVGERNANFYQDLVNKIVSSITFK